MGRVAFRQLLLCLVLLLLPTARAVGPDECPSAHNLAHNLMRQLYLQRDEGHRQFGFLVVGYGEDNIPPMSMALEPSDGEGHPLVDNTHAVYPANRNQYRNYVVARPYRDPRVWRTRHTEELLLQELAALIRANEHWRTHDWSVNFVLLYSRIVPCTDCTRRIVNAHNNWRNHDQRWFVAYSTYDIYEDTEAMNRNIQDMVDSGITVLFVPCEFRDLSRPTQAPRRAPHDELRRKRSVENVDTCNAENLFQGCVLGCVSNEIGLQCTNGGSVTPLTAAAAFVNWLADYCFPMYTERCADYFVDVYRRRACSCVEATSLKARLRGCLSTCIDRPLGKPFNLSSPYPLSLDVLADRNDLRVNHGNVPTVSNCQPSPEPVPVDHCLQLSLFPSGQFQSSFPTRHAVSTHSFPPYSFTAKPSSDVYYGEHAFVSFDSLLSDVGNMLSGGTIATVPVDGLYFVSIRSDPESDGEIQRSMSFYVTVNHERKFGAYGERGSPSGASAVLKLRRADEIWAQVAYGGGIAQTGSLFSMALLHPLTESLFPPYAFTAHPSEDRHYDRGSAVAFDSLLTENVGNMYDVTTSVAIVPVDGVYFVSIRSDPVADVQRYMNLWLIVNGVEMFGALGEQGVPSGASAALKLRQGNRVWVQTSRFEYGADTVQTGSLFSMALIHPLTDLPFPPYAFTAYPSEDRHYGWGSAVAFDSLLTENVGNMYDVTTSVAIVPVDGVYFVSIRSDPISHYYYAYESMNFYVMVNDVEKFGAYGELGVPGGASGALQLRKGDRVWVRTAGAGTVQTRSLFSMALLHPQC